MVRFGMARRPLKLPTGVRPGPPDFDGSPRWYIRWWVEGREHKPLIRAATAREAADERQARILSGNSKGSGGSQGSITVARARADLLPTRSVLATRIQDAGNLARLVETFGKRPIRSVTHAELRQWLGGLRKPDGSMYAPGSLKAFRRSCRVLWSWACENGHADSNPARELVVRDVRPSKGPAPATPKRHLEIDELRKLFVTLAELGPPAHSLMFRTQFRLGLRVSEVCTLRRDLIDWDTGAYTIDRAISQGEISPGKGKRQFQKYLSEPGRAELRDWIEGTPDPLGTGFVFLKPVKAGAVHPFYAPRYIRKSFDAALAKVPGHNLAPGTTTHSLRHSWYKIGESLGAALTDADIANALGNKPATAKKFYSSGPGLLARRLAEHLEALVFS